MQVSAFASRVQAQLAASRALLEQAPRCELTPAARALLALANASGPAPRAQRGESLPAVMVVMFVLLLTVCIGVGAVTAMHHGLGQLTEAVGQARR